MVYQEYNSIEKNQIIVVDIFKLSLNCQTSINPSNVYKKYLYMDDLGFNNYSITYSSDVI